MSDINTPRYGFAPTAAFAATRASAEQRRAREAEGAATTAARGHSRPSARLLPTIITRLTRRLS